MNIQYTVQTSTWLDFSQPIDNQMIGIDCTVFSSRGEKKGLIAINEERKDALPKIVRTCKGTPRYNYIILTNSKFPANSFHLKKPLFSHHVISVKVEKTKGTDVLPQEMREIEKALEPLNRFLKEVEPRSGKRVDIESWEKLLEEVIKLANQKAPQLRSDKIDNQGLRNIFGESRNKTLCQVLHTRAYKFFLPCILVAGWALFWNKFSMREMALFLFCRNASQLADIISALLSDEKGLSPSERENYLVQYLQAVEKRPDQLNIENLYSDISLPLHVYVEVFLLAWLMILTMYFAWRVCCMR